MTNTIILQTKLDITSPTSCPVIHRVNEPSNLIKTVSFRLWTGDLWERNPESHIYVMVDGWVKPGDPRTSLQGRGITIGHAPQGTGIGFEHFGEMPHMVGDFVPMTFMPNSFYDFVVECENEYVSWLIIDPDKNTNIAMVAKFSKDYPSYDTVLGIAGDNNSSNYSLFDVRQQLSKYDTNGKR